MDLQHGTWGKRWRLWQTPTELHTILKLKRNKRCSWHKHQHAYNWFFVISGEVTIKTDIGPNGQRNYTIIKEGDIPFVVKPGVMHEFQTKEKPAVVYEIAYVEYDSRDIYRLQMGGDMDVKVEST